MNMRDCALYLCIGTLFTHELDAVPNHEWRSLPLLQLLPDETGMVVFVAAHVPLFALLIALVASRNSRTRLFSQAGICGFVVVHGVLHALSVGQPAYEFSSVLSNSLIFGGSAFGAAYLLMEARQRYAART